MRTSNVRLAPLILATVLLAAAGGARACTSFVVNCSDGAVASARTIDFSTLDLIRVGSVDYIPAHYDFTAIPVAKGGNASQWNFKHAIVGTRGTFYPDSLPILTDALNDAGLTMAMNWQNNVTMFARYNASGPTTAMTVPDFIYYAMGMFATVEEVKAFLADDAVQLTTDIQDDATRSALTLLFSVDTDIPPPAEDGTLHMGIHLHFTDSTGAGLLVEGKVGGGGYSLYDTQVITNEPSFDLMLAWRDEYLRHDFSDVPGIKDSPTAPLSPALIPGNAALSNSSYGYFGSQSRYLRIWLHLQNCGDYPWPEQEWSPGIADVSVDPPSASFRALKRAENYVASVIVPMAQLTDDPKYASMITFLRDSTEMVYYYATPRYKSWKSVSLKELAAEQVNTILSFSFAPPDTPFATRASRIQLADASGEYLKSCLVQ